MRKLTSVVFLLSAGVCAPAFAQDFPEVQQSDSAETRPALSATGWIGVGTAATGVALLGWSFAEIDPTQFTQSNTVLLRRATGAVATAVGGGLVIFDLASKSSKSRLYVKFGSDGMPLLRWQTRF